MQYQISNVDTECMIAECLRAIESPPLLVSMCSVLFSDEVPTNTYLKETAANVTLAAKDEILKDEAAWEELYGNEQYMRQIVEMSA